MVAATRGTTWLSLMGAIFLASCSFDVPIPPNIRCASDDDCARFGGRCVMDSTRNARVCCSGNGCGGGDAAGLEVQSEAGVGMLPGNDAPEASGGCEWASACDGGSPPEVGPADAAGPIDALPPGPDLAPDLADMGSTPPDTAVDGEPEFTPHRLPGLVLWLDAQVSGSIALDSGKVRTWADQSGRGNDAFQAVPAMRPSMDDSFFPGHAAVAFGEGGARQVFLEVADGTDLQWGTDAFLVAMVAAGINTGAQIDLYSGALWRKTEPDYPFAGLEMFLAYPNPGQVTAQLSWEHQLPTAAATYNDGRPFVVIVRRTLPGGLEMIVNGLRAATDFQPSSPPGYQFDVSVAGHGVFIGSHGEGQDYQQLVGSIAEVVAVKGNVIEADLTALSGYLARKYGL